MAPNLELLAAVVPFFDIRMSKSCFFDILNWKCASRYSLVPFLTSALRKVVRDRQFFTFGIEDVLRATAACRFFHIPTSKKSGPKLVCLVHFDLKMCFAQQRHAIFTWIHTRRFSELTFPPSRPQIIGKTQCLATFPTFRASLSSFFYLHSSDSFSFSLLLQNFLGLLLRLWHAISLQKNMWNKWV